MFALIQVKSNYISPQEVQEIADEQVNFMAEKQVWVKKDRKPWRMALIEDPMFDPECMACRYGEPKEHWEGCQGTSKDNG